MLDKSKFEALKKSPQVGRFLLFVIRILFRELFVLITVCAEARCELTEKVLVTSGFAEYDYSSVKANELLASAKDFASVDLAKAKLERALNRINVAEM